MPMASPELHSTSFSQSGYDLGRELQSHPTLPIRNHPVTLAANILAGVPSNYLRPSSKPGKEVVTN
jgi:hypothetical protein